MIGLPTNPSESFKRRNPHIYPLQGDSLADLLVKSIQVERQKRIRQSQKPLLNKLETEWLAWANEKYYAMRPILPQSIGFRLANGVVYWPDFVSLACEHCWEIKGSQPIQDDSSVKIKVAARIYPMITWTLCWKKDEQWLQQVILP